MDGIAEAEAPTPCADRLLRLSGPIVYGRECGVRRRTARRCSRALPFGVVEDEADEDEAVAAMAMVTVDGKEVVKGGGEKRGGDEDSCW